MFDFLKKEDHYSENKKELLKAINKNTDAYILSQEFFIKDIELNLAHLKKEGTVISNKVAKALLTEENKTKFSLSIIETEKDSIKIDAEKLKTISDNLNKILKLINGVKTVQAEALSKLNSLEIISLFKDFQEL